MKVTTFCEKSNPIEIALFLNKESKSTYAICQPHKYRLQLTPRRQGRTTQRRRMVHACTGGASCGDDAIRRQSAGTRPLILFPGISGFQPKRAESEPDGRWQQFLGCSAVPCRSPVPSSRASTPRGLCMIRSVLGMDATVIQSARTPYDTRTEDHTAVSDSSLKNKEGGAECQILRSA